MLVSGHPPRASATARRSRRLRRFRLQRLRARGLTLIEVLMAMFVLAIGLFGVASLLPLGQKKVLEGMIDQRKAQTAESAFQYLAAQGGLNPTRWVTYAGVNYDAVKATTAARILCRVTGSPTASAFSTDAAGLLNVDNAYKDCALEFRTGKLRGQRRLIAGYVGATKTFQFDTTGTLGVAYNQFPGAPYVGDVLTNDVNGNGRYDPGDVYTDSNSNGVYDAPDTFIVVRNRGFAIDPLGVATMGAGGGDFALGMQRLTLSGFGTTTPMNLSAATSVFRSSDDLKFDTPKSNDDPTQLYYGEPYVDVNGNGKYDAGIDTYTDLNGNGTWDSSLRRKSGGNFSWIATVVPGAAANTDSYRVSIAVFYNRVIAPAGSDGGPVALQLSFVGNGFGGGTALLKATSASGTPQADVAMLRPNHWILVAATNGNDYRWYRVATIGQAFQDASNGNRWTRNVSLVGADWNPILSATTLEVMYYPGVVGVFDRVMSLDSLPDSAN